MEGSLFHHPLSSLTIPDAIARLNNLDIHGCQVTSKGTLTMDPRIWGTLPPDLLEKVLAQLSVSSLILTRVVRKKWNKEVYHGQLLSHLPSVEAPKKRSWLFMFDNRGTSEVHSLWAYDQRADVWYPLSLESIPHFSIDQTRAGWRLCAAAGGLLCFNFSALRSQFVGFCVCNPMTKSWRKLPHLNQRREKPIVTMFMDPTSESYTILVAGGFDYDDSIHSAEVYDSRSETWKVTCRKCIHYHNHVFNTPKSSTVYCKGAVYHLRLIQTMAMGDPNREYHAFILYNVAQAAWRPAKVPLPKALVFSEYPSLRRSWGNNTIHDTDVSPPFLVESNGRLLLVGFQDNEELTSLAGVSIWELDDANLQWNHLTSMPEKLFRLIQPQMCRSAYLGLYLSFHMQGAGHGDVIYMYQQDSTPSSQGNHNCSSSSTPVFLCNLAKEAAVEWKRIHRGFVQQTNYVDVHGCVIDLRLDTLI